MSGKKRNQKKEDIMEAPSATFDVLEEHAVEAGGAFEEHPDDKGAVGRTMFDMPNSEDGSVTVLMPGDNIDNLPNQALVRIKSRADNREYLGAIVKGPFAEPDGLRADATPLVITTSQGKVFSPRYHGRAQVELMGEDIGQDTLVPPRWRPKPNSPVFSLSTEETGQVLKCTNGEVRLGLADGYESLEVKIPKDKKVLPRHLGILGTTGGGKSTTVSGLIAQCQQSGIAAILIDTEGEYCAINEKAEDVRMVQGLNRRGLKPKGVENTTLYYLVGRDTNNPNHKSKHQFSLSFSRLSPYAISEIVGFNEAQDERFMKAYDITRAALSSYKIWPKTEDEIRKSYDLDEFSEGVPKMTVAHLYDVVQTIASCIDNSEPLPLKGFISCQGFYEFVKKEVEKQKVPKVISSWRRVQGMIGSLLRLGIFDTSDNSYLNYSAMLKPGAVSILDLSDMEESKVRNLVIAELLRGVQIAQDTAYNDAIKKGETPTPTLIFIEEAHEFLSSERIRKMPILFQQVAKIAKRGRKRWLGLVFITQLPQHLPSDVIGLINNWILHKIGDSSVVSQLKKNIGGFNENQWRHLTTLAPGQALCSFGSWSRPLQVSIDPSPCKLLMID